MSGRAYLPPKSIYYTERKYTMNKARRKSLQEILDKMDELRSMLETLKDEEEEYRDNIPENLWGSERYEKADEAVDNLDSALDSFDEIADYIESAME